MVGKGLDVDGTIAREGALSRVPDAFAGVVAAARARTVDAFGDGRLHSAYVYGSIPRGTARLGISDLDLLLALHTEPTEADRLDAARIEQALDQAFDQIDGVGILLFSRRTLLSELERHDLGFFVACLCTPLLGDDLADELPRYRPTALLARETNGDLSLALPEWGRQAARATTDNKRKSLSRLAARRIVRTGFTLVMPRWGGWTSDLTECAEAFGIYYPARAEQMLGAARIGRAPSADPAVLRELLDDLGPWLAAEYAAVHGLKAVRP
ncbi:nucleotidyltransferase domain-containing protein [Micromonospora sp. LAH09]|uniref:nucleotidyltransferase domain-containing protein n=1 Tax=Micromonospora cabrerizensis TaxID=2911213 RepID=UPI001EE94B7C|nr:nucleotidyltransferase domain-containing protein [Micromonospora cabrerizensis]MCG5469087.1 nucleotidyltransferase domain-containing protein [Micromonospora cabrerizensis]